MHAHNLKVNAIYACTTYNITLHECQNSTLTISLRFNDVRPDSPMKLVVVASQSMRHSGSPATVPRPPTLIALYITHDAINVLFQTEFNESTTMSVLRAFRFVSEPAISINEKRNRVPSCRMSVLDECLSRHDKFRHFRIIIRHSRNACKKSRTEHTDREIDRSQMHKRRNPELRDILTHDGFAVAFVRITSQHLRKVCSRGDTSRT